jgi:hypothetical protein
MARILRVVDWRTTPVSWAPNTRSTLLSQQFTPIATGRGVYAGTIDCYTYRDAAPTGNVYPVTFVQVDFYLDGVLQQNIGRGWRTWVLDTGVGEQHIEIPFWFPWTASLNTTHQISIQVSNYNNADGTTDPNYHMILVNEWTELGIEEDPEPGLGSSSSYLVAGAIPGSPGAAALLGAWVSVYPFTFPASLTGSWALSRVAATGTVDFDIQVNGVSKGSIRWASGQTVAGYNFPAAVSIAVGDRIELYGNPGVVDPVWTLRGIL